METVYKKEADLQAAIILYLEARNYVAYNIITASKNGVSDVVACIEGLFCVIEVKLDYNTANDLQLYKQNQVRQTKGYCIVAKSLKDVKELINWIKTDPRSTQQYEPYPYSQPPIVHLTQPKPLG